MYSFKPRIVQSLNDSANLKQKIASTMFNEIEQCGNILADCIKSGGKILFCGNGGSAADSQHLAAELVVRLRGSVNRGAITAIALTVDTSILTAGGNDIGFDNIFARGVEAYSKAGDVLVGISTSGNSENVLRAVNKARELGVTSVGLLGCSGGKIASICDQSIIVPSNETARIQESHITIGHIWCEMIEEINFPEFFNK